METRFVLKIVGVFISVVGLVLIFCMDSIFHYILTKKLALFPNSPVYESWRRNAVPITMDIYIFNWTNPEKVTTKNVKPNFVEMGPYRFHEYHEKVNIIWNENNTVSYNKKVLWFHDDKTPSRNLTDHVTILNPVAVGVNYMARYWSQFISYPVSTALAVMERTVWMRKTAGEILFDGYEDPLMNAAASIPGLSSLKVPQDKVGYFYGKNDTTDLGGILNVDTGTQDISKLGTVRGLNHKSHYNIHGEADDDGISDECREIKGTSGELYPPGQTREKPLEMFSSQLCRSVTLDYLEDAEIHGINGFRYVLSKKALDNGTTYPDSWCNCNGDCLPQGVMNVSSCRSGVPAFVSLPHFMDADPYYTNQVNGLKPDMERHRFQITLEPITGIPLDVSARFQYNLLLYRNPKLRMFQDVPTILLPQMWFEERVTIPPESAASLRTLLMVPTMGFYCSIGLLLFGVILIVLTFLPSLFKTKRWSPTASRERPSPEENSLNEISKAVDLPEKTPN